MKKIWLICLCLAGLSLAWCFHIPDEDWLPSRNNVKNEDVEKNIEKDKDIEQAINSLVQWVNMISSDWNELKDEEGSDEVTENDDVEISGKNTNNEEITDDKAENEEIEKSISSEWEI